MKKGIAFILILSMFFLGSIYLINHNNSSQYILLSSESITQLRVNDVEIKDDKLIKEFSDIFSKYKYSNNKQKKLEWQSGYTSVFQVDFMIEDKIRHILLGDIDIIYESSEVYYNIISGDRLTDEVSKLLNVYSIQ